MNILKAWRIRRLRSAVENLEWYVVQLDRAIAAHRRLAEQKRVELAQAMRRS
jgi:hypothetical protein